MYHGPPPGFDRSLSWRSILTGYAVMVGVFVLMVAVSYPTITLALIATGTGAYGLYRTVRTRAATGRVRIPGTHLGRRLSRRPR